MSNKVKNHYNRLFILKIGNRIRNDEYVCFMCLAVIIYIFHMFLKFCYQNKKKIAWMKQQNALKQIKEKKKCCNIVLTKIKEILVKNTNKVYLDRNYLLHNFAMW